jgi:hypothetical protein
MSALKKFLIIAAIFLFWGLLSFWAYQVAVHIAANEHQTWEEAYMKQNSEPNF